MIDFEFDSSSVSWNLIKKFLVIFAYFPWGIFIPYPFELVREMLLIKV